MSFAAVRWERSAAGGGGRRVIKVPHVPFYSKLLPSFFLGHLFRFLATDRGLSCISGAVVGDTTRAARVVMWKGHTCPGSKHIFMTPRSFRSKSNRCDLQVIKSSCPINYISEFVPLVMAMKIYLAFQKKYH